MVKINYEEKYKNLLAQHETIVAKHEKEKADVAKQIESVSEILIKTAGHLRSFNVGLGVGLGHDRKADPRNHTFEWLESYPDEIGAATKKLIYLSESLKPNDDKYLYVKSNLEDDEFGF